MGSSNFDETITDILMDAMTDVASDLPRYLCFLLYEKGIAFDESEET